MKLISVATVTLGGVLFFGLNSTARGECPGGNLAVVVHPSNPIETISLAQLRKMMLGEVAIWPNHKNVSLIQRPPHSEIFRCILSNVLHMTDAEYKRYLINLQFRGDQEVAAKVMETAATAGSLVALLPGAITIMEADAVSGLAKPVKVVKIDGLQPGDPGYPL